MRRWLQFGPYRLDVATCALFCENAPVSVTPKAVEVLRVLVQAGGSVVSKEMLLDEVWAGTFVEESSITKNISELRTALRLRGNGTQFIETLPRRGYRLSVPVQQASEDPGHRPSGRKTLAVLPFRTWGIGLDEDSIGLRLADALITRLATSKGFRVRPTEAVSRYQGSGIDRAAAGKDLDADLVLDGSIQQLDGTIRVTVQLLDVADYRPVWGESFDHASQNLLNVETELAEELTAALTMFVSAEDGELLSRRYTENSEAYRLYLRGRFHLGQRCEKGLQSAIEWFRRAIELDPEYALAYSGLALSYAMQPMLTSGAAKQFMPKARAAAAKALDLDDALVEAHGALALVKWHYDFDWRWAEREFKVALQFQPDHATTHQWYALLLAEMGRGEEAIAEARKAQALDSVSAAIHANCSTAFYLACRYREAMDMARESLDLDPESLRAHWVMGASLEQLGNLGDAIVWFEKACGISHGSPHFLGSLGHAYGIAGRLEEAASTLKALRRRRPRRCFFEESLITLGLGYLPEALDLLERACKEREFHVVLLRADARFAGLQSMPQFQSILSRIGLTHLS